MATYKTVHWQLAEFRGRASDQQCAQCDGPAQEWSYDGTDPYELTDLVDARGTVAKYSLDLDHYVPLCRSCHRLKDARHSTHCPHGHEFNEANTRITLDSAGKPYRVCRSCQTVAQRRCRARKLVTR